jgi:hypothetical protein
MRGGTVKHMIHPKRRSLFTGLVSVFMILCLLPAAGIAKLVICIDHDPAAEDGFLASAEGWARTLATVPPDVICLNGNIEDCLANLEDGDSLILIAHGLADEDGTDQGSEFRWGGNDYRGFGTGPGEAPVPEGFSDLENVWYRIVSCWSANDPDGEGGTDESMVDKLGDAMGGPTHEHTGSGYVGVCATRPFVRYNIPAGMSAEEQAAWEAAIAACLDADTTWMNAPPTNRSTPPPVPNQLTAAQAIIDACGIVPHPVLTGIDYSTPPTDERTFADRGTVIITSNPEYCEQVYWTLIGTGNIPTLSEWAMIVMAVMLLAMLTWFVARKRGVARSRIM